MRRLFPELQTGSEHLGQPFPCTLTKSGISIAQNFLAPGGSIFRVVDACLYPFAVWRSGASSSGASRCPSVVIKVEFQEALAAEDGRRFGCVVDAARHQQRIELKGFLLELSVRELAANSEETASTEFDERLAEWMLSEPTRTSILEILRMIGQIVLPDGTPSGVDGFTAPGWWTTKEWCPPSSGIVYRAFS